MDIISKEMFLIYFCILGMVSGDVVTGIAGNMTTTASCPETCRCTFTSSPHPNITVDCSNRANGSIPTDIPPETTVLDLRSTRLSHVPPYALSYLKRLKVLYLGSNPLSKLDNDSFAGLTALEHLDLSPISFKMNVDYEHFPTDVFRDLSQLKILIFGGMYFGTHIQTDYIARTLAPLRQLEQLFLPHAPHDNLVLGPGYGNLTALKTLTFRGKKSEEEGTKLRKQAFVWLKNNPIERLAFVDCGIDSMEPGTMMAFPLLRTLDVECSNFFSAKKAEDFVCDLKHTSIETLRMNKIFQRKDDIAQVSKWTLQANFFECIKDKDIKVLELTDNKIEEFDFDNFRFLNHLEYIDLSNNNILYAVKNGVNSIRGDSSAYIYKILAQIWNIRFIRFDNNVVSTFKSSPPCEFSYTFWHGHPRISVPEILNIQLDDSNKGSTDLPTYNGSMTGRILKFSLPENFEFWSTSWWPAWHFGSYDCDTVTDSVFVYPNNLRYLSVSSIGAMYLCYEVYGLNRLEYLDISHNRMLYLPKYFFNHLPSLLYLNMKENQIGPLISEGNLAPLRLPRLRTLDLSFNKIRSIPKDFFAYMYSLGHLDLSGNRLATLSFSMSNFNTIRFIDLSDNQLHALSKEDVKLVSKLKASKDVVLNLRNNPVNCSRCGAEAFVQWLLTTNVTMTFSEDSTCVANGSTSLLQDTLSRLQSNCDNIHEITSQQWLSLAISMAVLVGVTCGLIVIYIYRWNIKYRLYILRRRLRRRGVLTTPPGHVYVSYDDSNHYWVINELLRHLEDDKGLDVIIDQRDFIGGAPLAEAIVEAVDNSRKTVLVLSESYVLNPWCEFEFQMSLARGYYSLIPVMFQPVPFDIMPKSLRKYIKARGYIKWTDSREGQHLFWKRLTDAIFNSGDQFDNHTERDENMSEMV